MKKRILIIEDEKDLVKILGFRMEDAGYEMIAALDGEDGLKKAREERPDLIILDLMLPKMNGYKICELLKKDPAYSAIPIIMLTAKAQKADIKLGKAAGAEAYITKPFESEDLLAEIKALLKET